MLLLFLLTVSVTAASLTQSFPMRLAGLYKRLRGETGVKGVLALRRQRTLAQRRVNVCLNGMSQQGGTTRE